MQNVLRTIADRVKSIFIKLWKIKKLLNPLSNLPTSFGDIFPSTKGPSLPPIFLCLIGLFTRMSNLWALQDNGCSSSPFMHRFRCTGEITKCFDLIKHLLFDGLPGHKWPTINGGQWFTISSEFSHPPPTVIFSIIGLL